MLDYVPIFNELTDDINTVSIGNTNKVLVESKQTCKRSLIFKGSDDENLDDL